MQKLYEITVNNLKISTHLKKPAQAEIFGQKKERHAQGKSIYGSPIQDYNTHTYKQNTRVPKVAESF